VFTRSSATDRNILALYRSQVVMAATRDSPAAFERRLSCEWLSRFEGNTCRGGRAFGLYSVPARGAHPVRGKGRAHPTVAPTIRTFFQPDRADSRRAMRGDSYVPQPARGAASPVAPEH
jgi:hypothetical protein